MTHKAEDNLEERGITIYEGFFETLLRNSNALQSLEEFLKSGGMGLNDAYCFNSPDNDLDPPLQPGFVRFGIDVLEIEEDIPHSEYLKYLRISCERYIRQHPEDEFKVIEILRNLEIDLRL